MDHQARLSLLNLVWDLWFDCLGPHFVFQDPLVFTSTYFNVCDFNIVLTLVCVFMFPFTPTWHFTSGLGYAVWPIVRLCCGFLEGREVMT